VKIEEDEEFPASQIQRVETRQEDIAAKEVNDTNKMDNRLMPREATIYFVFSILHPKNPSLEMCE